MGSPVGEDGDLTGLSLVACKLEKTLARLPDVGEELLRFGSITADNPPHFSLLS